MIIVSLYGYDSIQPCEPIGSKSGRQKNKKIKRRGVREEEEEELGGGREITQIIQRILSLPCLTTHLIPEPSLTWNLWEWERGRQGN